MGDKRSATTQDPTRPTVERTLWKKTVEDRSEAVGPGLQSVNLVNNGNPRTELCAVMLFRAPGSPPSNSARSSATAKFEPLVALVGGADGTDDERVEYVRRLCSSQPVRKALTGILDPGANGHGSGREGAPEERSATVKRTPRRIAVKTQGKILLADPAEVMAIEAHGNYVLLKTRSRSQLLRESVSAVADKLERFGFVRIHRSTIVNQAFVEEIRVSRAGDMLLRLKGEAQEYNVSRKYRSALKSIASCWI